MKYIVAAIVSLSLACGGSEKSVEQPQEPDDRIDVGDRDGTRTSAVPELEDDDDDDDGFDVQGLRGHLEAGEADRVIRQHHGKIVACFSKTSKKWGWLGGDIKLFFAVTTEGTVKQVHAESDIGSWEVESCVLALAQAMTFKPPRGGEAEFEQTLNFPSRRPHLPWDEAQTEKEVTPKLAELEACEGAPGDVWVTLYVGTRGKVLSAGFSAGDKQPIEPTWAACARGVVTRWTLSDPRGRVAKAFFRYSP